MLFTPKRSNDEWYSSSHEDYNAISLFHIWWTHPNVSQTGNKKPLLLHLIHGHAISQSLIVKFDYCFNWAFPFTPWQIAIPRKKFHVNEGIFVRILER